MYSYIMHLQVHQMSFRSYIFVVKKEQPTGSGGLGLQIPFLRNPLQGVARPLSGSAPTYA